MTETGSALFVRLVLSAFLGLAFFPTPASALNQNGPTSVAPLAKRLSDAVVNIATSQTVKGPQGVPLPRVPKGAPFEDFFDDFFNKRGGIPHSDRRISSLGSGFVIDGKKGLIVTNNHVIEGAEEIDVNFHDGTSLTVDKIIGRDAKSDLALLKVTPKKPLAEVKFGSSSAIEVGDWVMAIGNPFGLGGSVSVGIISAKSRDINSGPYDDYLQTDAAINKGNSGGPLFNMDGEVVGVNTAIISPTGGSIGIGFAVPSDTAARVIEQLKEYGEVRRGWLGVKIQSVTDDVAAALGVPAAKGALVSAVTPSGPAAKAGMEPGDVILEFDGQQVTSVRGLPRIVAQAQIGKAVDVELMRKGQMKTLNVVIGRLEDQGDADEESAPDEQDSQSGAALLGLKLSAITPELRKKYGLDDKITGVVVEAVDPESPAGEKGIKPGDVIVEAAQDSISQPDDVARSIDKIRKSGRKAVLLRVENGKGELRFIAVPLS
jgi:serine protease Do